MVRDCTRLVGDGRESLEASLNLSLCSLDVIGVLLRLSIVCCERARDGSSGQGGRLVGSKCDETGSQSVVAVEDEGRWVASWQLAERDEVS